MNGKVQLQGRLSDIADSVADRHHLGTDPDPSRYFDADLNPDPACHFDPDPETTVQFDADPDPGPSFPI
jgi:hypothetical protein